VVERLQAGTIRSDPSSTRIHVGRDLQTNDHHICNLCKNRARTPIRALSQWNTLKSIHFLYIPVYFTKNSIVHLLQDMLICQIFGTYIKGIWDWEPPFYGPVHHQSPIPAVCQAVRPPLDVFRRAVSGHLGRKPGDLWDLWDHQKEWEKMVKQGYWDNIPVIVPCYGFYVIVQGFFLIFDVSCDTGFGKILPLTFTVDVWIEWG